MHVVYMSTHVL